MNNLKSTFTSPLGLCLDLAPEWYNDSCHISPIPLFKINLTACFLWTQPLNIGVSRVPLYIMMLKLSSSACIIEKEGFGILSCFLFLVYVAHQITFITLLFVNFHYAFHWPHYSHVLISFSFFESPSSFLAYRALAVKHALQERFLVKHSMI